MVGARTDKPVLLTLCVLDDSPEVREHPSQVGGSSGVRAFMHNWTDRGAHGIRFSRKWWNRSHLLPLLCGNCAVFISLSSTSLLSHSRLIASGQSEISSAVVACSRTIGVHLTSA